MIVVLHLDNSSPKAYLCNQSGTVYLSFQTSLPHIESGWQYGITLISVYMFTHHKVETSTYHGEGWLQGDIFLMCQKQYFNFGVNKRCFFLASSCTNQCQHYYTLENALHLEGMGLNTFNHPQICQVSCIFHPPALVPLILSRFLVEHVPGWFRLLILVAPCFIEASWLPIVLNILEGFPHYGPIIKVLSGMLW